jgi:HD superfamily phosphohydrolase
VDNYQFQLLDWRRQLGTAHLIYRNAHHTRLEHSFGVFELSRRLSSIFNSNERKVYFPVKKINGYLVVDTFYNEKKKLTANDFNLLHVASLVHDIGNYPFCHQLERSLILGILNHEQIGSMIIRRAFRQIEFLDDNDLAQLDIIEKRDSLADIINTKSKDISLSPSQVLFKNIISGPYGVDFLDYIYRDSFYCGFSTRSAVDFLLDHAIVIFDSDNETYNFGFTQHVLHELASLAYLRLDMERKVYSNKTHKIISEMLAHAIRAAVNEAKLNINELCLFTDDGLLSDLERRDAPDESRRQIQLIRSRKLYEIVYRFDAMRRDVNPTVRHALKMWGLQQIIELKERIHDALADKNIGEEDILVSFPHPEERICKEGEIFILLESGEVKRLGELDPWISHYQDEYMNIRKYLVLLSDDAFHRVGDIVKDTLSNNFENWVLEIQGIKRLTVQSLEEKWQSLSSIEQNILNMLLERGFTAEELAASFRKSRSTMVYHLNNLNRVGLVGKERRGKKMLFNVLAEYAPYISKMVKTEKR